VAAIGRVWALRHSRLADAAQFEATCYGATDVRVSSRDAEAIAIRVSATIPDGTRIVTSPLVRCDALARKIFERVAGSSLQQDARLAEMDFGRWEGLAWCDIERDQLDAWAADPMHYNGHGGESVAQLQTRVRAAFLEHTQSAGELPSLLVTHNGPIRCLLVAMQATQTMKAIDVMQVQGISYGELIELHAPHIL
jgi:alpha-ribazole phosphatase